MPIIMENKETPLCLTSAWIPADNVSANVRLSYRGGTLLLTYTVKEPQLRRMCVKSNDQVWTDSCVEAFLQREGDDEYRNFEFSAAGYALVGRGKGRNGRVLYDGELVGSIPLKVTIRENTLEESIWSLHAEIALEDYGLLEKGDTLKGKTLKGNFYNCGDKLAVPHFLMYAPIDTIKPDFHQPSFFVPLLFR